MSYIAAPHPKLAELAPNGQQKVDFLAWYNDGFVITNRHLLANPARPDVVSIKLLPEALTQPKIVPRLGIVHTQASGGKASNSDTWTFLSRASANEPHVIGPEFATGKVLQCMPFDQRADCNSAANRFFVDGSFYGAVSIEVQDLGGSLVDNTPFDDAQQNTIIGILTALCATYGIWCTEVAHDATVTAWRGLSYHSAVPSWSGASHSCPGAARRSQMAWIIHNVATRLAHYYGAVGETCPS